ncbi:DUF3953 domain-containing protein [Peribacillus loiseleuriae]|uniref:DUF3953 domain-containing protein n=1 Tax=Peribacillus loiseleuriae TaxID=1679170 RepID=UPI00381434D7
MLKILRIVLSVIVFALAGYSLITKNFEFIPYMMLFLGANVLVTGLIELQKDQKGVWGYMYIIASLFPLYVSRRGVLIKLTGQFS